MPAGERNLSARERLSPPAEFADRHCGLSPDDQAAMLKDFDCRDLEAFGAKVLPASIRAEAPPDLGPALSESDALTALRAFAEENRQATSLLGLGYAGAEMPAVIRRCMLENPAWYTAYTPYQAEISQGRLEMLLNFQTMASDLTGLDLSGASLLDEGTAAAEAMTLLRRTTKNDGHRFLVDRNLFPQTLAVLKTRAEPLGIELDIDTPEALVARKDGAFGALFGYPGGDGALHDPSAIVADLKAAGIPSACATDLLALTLIRPPGELGFDIAFGNSQRFGLPMGFGGPHAAFFSFREAYTRFAPGRVVGVSRDAGGRTGYRLALQAREQHIRREKATSNICTAQALPAMLAAAYAVYHGPERLKDQARRVNGLAATIAAGLRQMQLEVAHPTFFDTLRVRGVDDPQAVIANAEREGLNLLLTDDGEIGISADELTRPAHAEAVWRAFGQEQDFEQAAKQAADSIPDDLRRRSAFLEHPVFNRYHTEHEMLRYLRRLADKDIALNRSMIPLGSCTMKLNAATEMLPLTWRSFADIHPFAPREQTAGFRRLIADLERLLATATGFAAVSMQPNAGAQGEYAGLLAIRAFQRSRGETRDVCLIPKSAHGTNPASAILAGLRVVPVEIDEHGQILVSDLRDKAAAYPGEISAAMLTFPSTCGVFGAKLTEICDIVHEAGGQVYMDGANLNAMVGAAFPGQLGPDVMHINLHKTFCIPHGGGGPGMGPIAAAAHLAPFLPDHPLEESDRPGCGTVSSAMFGSPLILLIPWLYMRMMGGAGLRRATLTALLSANYAARRLAEAFPLQYAGDGGLVAHECVLDARGFKKTAGITVEDIAKRLMDYGYHAPTVSWPLPGAVMVEPTESESKAELDRFCEAMLAIRAEIARIEAGEWPRDDNPLVHAPHTAEAVLGEWSRAYDRNLAAHPLEWVRADKYWPPVSRIDAAWGDRNLACACPPIEDYLGNE